MKRTTNDSNAIQYLLKLHNSNIVEAAVNLLMGKKTENYGRLPHGVMTQIIAEMKILGVVTDRDDINYLMRRS
jgi:hypothetical protein